MLRPQLSPPRRINLRNFSAVLSLIVAVIVLSFSGMPTQFHHGVAVSLPHAYHARPMPGADREDALVITVLRDGKILLDAQMVSPAELQVKLHERINSGPPRLIFLKADARARYRSVSAALSSVRAAGQTNIGILVK